MMKEIGVQGQQVKLYSQDGGRTWSSSPQSIVAYGQRKKKLRLELQRSFAEIDEKRDLDPDNFNECETTNGLTTAKAKNHAPGIGKKVLCARLGTGHPSDRAVSGGSAQSLSQSGKQVGVPDHQQFYRNGHRRGRRPRPDQLTQ